MFGKKTVRDVDVEDKRVLVRVDYNVPLGEAGEVADDMRIRASLPTLRYLIDKGARIVLASHLGRPGGQVVDGLRLDPVVAVLSHLLGRNVYKVDDVAGEAAEEAVERMVPGEVLILGNLRFEPGEKANDPQFARSLAGLADVYVDDAFGAVHRAHASTVGVAEHLPAVAGLLLAREMKTLQGMLEEAEHPFVAVLGGSKVSDKLAVVENLIDRVDALLVGGGMCFTFLRALGVSVGRSIVEEDWVEAAGRMLERAEESGTELELPVDFVVAKEATPEAETQIVGRNEIPEDASGLDIGPATTEHFKETIAYAKTVFWNGPMGVFELEPFETGTRMVAAAIARNTRALTVVGGGDSDAALRKYGLEERITFVSTGGGASMKLLEGSSLPGVEALDDKE